MRSIDEVRAQPVDEHGTAYVEQDGKRIALCTQTGFSCLHAIRSPTDREMIAAGYTTYRIVGFLDMVSVCDACKKRRTAARAKKAARS